MLSGLQGKFLASLGLALEAVQGLKENPLVLNLHCQVDNPCILGCTLKAADACQTMFRKPSPRGSGTTNIGQASRSRNKAVQAQQRACCTLSRH